MFAFKSIILTTVLFAIGIALPLDNNYNDNDIMLIRDLFEIENNNTIQVQSIDSIKAFQKLHPNLQVEEMHSISTVRGQIVYHLGARMASDRLVGHAAKSQSWPSPQNVAIQLSYPSSGIGALVTYVYVTIVQTSNLGRAYVARGGIHQHFITIVVEAYTTTVANYDCQIYGI